MPNTRGADAPQAAARRLLAAGAWVTAAGYADLVRARLPDDKARRCYARLVRTGSAPTGDPADQLRIGRERLAQEALQRLVQRGECEAAGAGRDRQYRLIGTGVKEQQVFSPRPKSRREWVPIERLAFDIRLQMRDLRDADGKPSTFHEPHVIELLEARQGDDPVTFEPIEAVEEVRKGKQPVLWVFRGFHRGEMYRRAGENSVEVVVYPGAYSDALFYSLSENDKRELPRTPGDRSKAIRTLIDSPDLLERVRRASKGSGGLHRGMAAACRVSRQLVEYVIRERGLRVEDMRLVPITRSTSSHATGAPPVHHESAPAPTPEPDPADPADAGPAPEPDSWHAPYTAAAEPAYTVPAPRPEHLRLADAADSLRSALEAFAATEPGADLLHAGSLAGGSFVQDLTPQFIAAVGAGQHRDTANTGDRRLAAAVAHAERVDPVPPAQGPQRVTHCRWLQELSRTLRGIRT